MDGDVHLKGRPRCPLTGNVGSAVQKFKAQQPWSPPSEGDGAWARETNESLENGATVEGPVNILISQPGARRNANDRARVSRSQQRLRFSRKLARQLAGRERPAERGRLPRPQAGEVAGALGLGPGA